MLQRVSIIVALLVFAPSAQGMDHVVYRDGQQQREITGKVVVTAEDGGLLVLGRDARLQTVEPQDLVSHTSDDVPFEPYSKEELSRQILDELPRGFAVHETENYLIFHNTSRAYAQWCGGLFERLFWAFENFWSRKGLDLHEPEFPLVAVVFADSKSYADYARDELGDAAESVVGYYSLRTNRMNMFDLTGTAGVRRPGDRRQSSEQINAMLSRPQAAQTVATVIHEATHQLAFNVGLQTRYADVPLWLSEGLAVYFETPDLRSSKGWRTIGDVNRGRLATFKSYQRKRQPDSLGTLLATDDRFRNGATAGDAYGEAWALTYYLINRHEDKFVEYLKAIAEKPRLVWDSPEERIQQFQKIFGSLNELDEDFLRAMRRVK